MSKSISDLCYNRLDLSYNWLDLSNVSNKWRQSYIQGFLDISGGDVIVRRNKLFVGGDVSFNSNLSVSGDVLFKKLRVDGNLTIKELSTCKRLIIYSDLGQHIYPACKITDVSSNKTINFTPNSLSNSINNCIPAGSSVIYADNADNNINASTLTLTTNANTNCGIVINPSLVTISTVNGLTISGDVSVKSNLIVTGNASVNSNLTVRGKMYIASTLDVSGIATALSFNTTSDYRIKENIQPLNLNFTVDLLNPVSYYNKIKHTQDIGFIAHEVQEYFPELVTGERDGQQTQSINYNGLIPILVKELQELKKNVRSLEQEIYQIRNEILNPSKI